MQKLKKYKIIAVVFAVIVIPLVYSFFYLDAFWDPYSKLDQLPVAVVNQDEGAAIDGENRNLGKEITDELKSDKNLKWVITTDSEAKEGLKNRKYYASIYIPGDFSKNISTAGDSEKSKGILIYNVNEKRNYLASQVLSRVTLEFKDTVSEKISKEMVNTLVNQIQDIPGDLKTLDDGLKKLNDGTAVIYDKTGELIDGQNQFNAGVKKLNAGLKAAGKGSTTLVAGARELSKGAALFSQNLLSGASQISVLTDGSSEFASGLSSVNSGLNTLNTGSQQLYQATGELNEKMNSYSDNMQNFSTGLNNYVESVNKAADAQTALANLVAKYASAHPEALKDSDMQTILNTLKAAQNVSAQMKQAGEKLSSSGVALTDASSKLSEGVTKVNSGMAALSESSSLLSGGTGKLNGSYSRINNGIAAVAGNIRTAADKSKDLSNGASTLETGTEQLSSGIVKASSGSQELYENSVKLYDGEKKLKDGLGELQDGMSQASQGVSSSLLKTDDKLSGTDGLGEYISQPVKFNESRLDSIPDYGTAFTPYFVSLSLWVGALMMFFAIYLDPEVRFRRMASNSRGILRFASYTFIGIAQALVLDMVLLKILHLQARNTALFFAVSIIIALAFTSIMRFLLVQLRDVGKFIAILLLILQLTSCGGTFPMELVPDFFKVINPFMPMTYSVNSLKEVISGADSGFLLQNVIVLGSIAVSFLILNFIASKVRLGKLLADTKETGRPDSLTGDAYAEA